MRRRPPMCGALASCSTRPSPASPRSRRPRSSRGSTPPVEPWSDRRGSPTPRGTSSAGRPTATPRGDTGMARHWRLRSGRRVMSVAGSPIDDEAETAVIAVPAATSPPDVVEPVVDPGRQFGAAADRATPTGSRRCGRARRAARRRDRARSAGARSWRSGRGRRPRVGCRPGRGPRRRRPPARRWRSRHRRRRRRTATAQARTRATARERGTGRARARTSPDDRPMSAGRRPAGQPAASSFCVSASFLRFVSRVRMRSALPDIVGLGFGSRRGLPAARVSDRAAIRLAIVPSYPWSVGR